MDRRIEVVVPPQRTDELASLVKAVPGVLSLRVQRGAMLLPQGDLITIDAQDSAHLELVKQLTARGVGADGHGSLRITQGEAHVAPQVRASLMTARSECTWEQVESVFAKESNLTRLSLLVMAVSGAFAATGLLRGSLHIVLAAMLVAPGFEPVIRIPFTWLRGAGSGSRAALQLVLAYATLMAGAALTALILMQAGALGGGYHSPGALFDYWMQPSLASVLLALSGGAAGAALLASDRSVLTAGIMVAVALVPSACMVPIGLVGGDVLMAWRALLRWLLEVGLVAAGATAFWVWYRFVVQPRRSLL